MASEQDYINTMVSRVVLANGEETFILNNLRLQPKLLRFEDARFLRLTDEFMRQSGFTKKQEAMNLFSTLLDQLDAVRAEFKAYMKSAN